MNRINIVITDDHKIFREGLAGLLDREDHLHIVGDAGDAPALWQLLEAHRVDLVIMDIDLGTVSGIDLTRELKAKYPDIMVLALSMHGEKNYIVKMMESGASGYILKNAGKEEMLSAVTTVANGDTYLSKQVSSTLIEQLLYPEKPRKKQDGIPLTDRELEVLRFIADEYSNAEIAERLFISIRTVDTHRRNLLEKLAVKNTAGLVKYALRNGLLNG